MRHMVYAIFLVSVRTYTRQVTRAVRLSSAQNFYFDPFQGEPTPQTFVDEESRASSRLFGQGAEMQIARLSVVSAPAPN